MLHLPRLNADLRRDSVASLIVSSILFSLSFGLIKAEVATLDPFVVAFLRLLISFAALAPFLRGTIGRRSWLLGAIGFVQFGVMYCLYIASFKTLKGHQVAILTTTTPLFVTLFDAIADKRLAKRALLAAVIAVVAGLVVVLDLQTLSLPLIGVMLVVTANGCFALGQVWYKHAFDGTASARSFAWMYLGALLAPLLAGLVFSEWAPLKVPATPRQWGAIIYLGLVPSGIGFYLWNRGTLRVPVAVVAVMNNLKVPLAVLLAWLLFGETINPLETTVSFVLIGLALWVARPS